MGITYLLDGYNIVRHEAFDAHRSAAGNEVADLLRLLRRCRPQGRNRFLVVLDGFPSGGSSPLGNDELVYARTVTADEMILRRVRSADHPAAIRVVTDDRLLQREVRAAGASWIGVSAFLAPCRRSVPEESADAVGRAEKHERVDERRITEELARIWGEDVTRSTRR